MKISDVKQLLPILVKHRITPMIWGDSGVGKTQVVEQVFSMLGYNIIHLYLASQDPGDLIGLLINNGDGTVKHARPGWFPTTGKNIIFLDEFNRAHPEVWQIMFPFALSGRLHTHILPEDSWIVCAGNYDNDSFNVLSMDDSALTKRFCHIDFQPTVQEFCAFAEDRGAYDIADFIAEHPESLGVKSTVKPIFDKIQPSPRGMLDMLNPLEKEPINNIRYEVYSGIVGRVAAASYMTWQQKREKKLRGRDILNRYEEFKPQIITMFGDKEARFDAVNAIFEEIMLITQKTKLTDQQLENFKQFFMDVPLAMGLKISQRLHDSTWEQKPRILNDKTFVEQFKRKKL